MNNWLALYVAVVWYCEITVDQVYRVISTRKFHNIDKLEKKYKMHRCDICKSILQRYGGESMSVCGDGCRGAGRPKTRKYADVVKEEKQDIRERKAKENTNTAKSIMQALKAGEKVILT